MRRTVIGLMGAALLLAACGGGEGTDTTDAAQAPDTQADEATAPAETTAPPETSPPTTSAQTTTSSTSPPATNPNYDYGSPGDGGDSDDGQSDGAASGGVGVAETELGEVLVGPDGLTLYIFLPDEQGDSTCYDSCASTWPPLEGDVPAGDGIDGEMLGTTERDDGSTQATYNGWPLYYYAGDTEAGDVTGQGVGGNWFVLDPAGEVVEG
ncbi:MAG: hypothetical protein ACLFWM_00335 [Actinomycetota bacterium]